MSTRWAPDERRTSGSPGWDAFVPFRTLEVSKSRLSGLGEPIRRDLALAMLLDTLDGLALSRSVGRVHLVTDDPEVAAAADITDLVHRGGPEGLNEALIHAMRTGRRPEVGCLAVMGDLPALHADCVDAVVGLAATEQMSMVTDAAGLGTTMLIAPAYIPLQPAFGADSAGRHAQRAVPLLDLPPCVRADVDDPRDLLRVREIGLGPRTARVLAAVDLDIAVRWSQPPTVQGRPVSRRR